MVIHHWVCYQHMPFVSQAFSWEKVRIGYTEIDFSESLCGNPIWVTNGSLEKPLICPCTWPPPYSNPHIRSGHHINTQLVLCICLVCRYSFTWLGLHAMILQNSASYLIIILYLYGATRVPQHLTKYINQWTKQIDSTIHYDYTLYWVLYRVFM